jgi:hypothetical protein
MTLQKIYAVLRKAGHQAAKWHSSGMVRGWGDWSPGVRVERGDGLLLVTYKVYGSGGAERIRNTMESYIVPALNADGIHGDWSEDRLVYTVRAD